MLVKVAPYGERVVEVNVDENGTIADALRISSVSQNGRAIRVGGQSRSASDRVRDGDIIVLANKVEAGR